jgi:hypothetical protein
VPPDFLHTSFVGKFAIKYYAHNEFNYFLLLGVTLTLLPFRNKYNASGNAPLPSSRQKISDPSVPLSFI